MGDVQCRTKIILDGDNVSGLLQGLCEATTNLTAEQTAMLTDEKAYPIIKILINMEEEAIKCQNLLLDAISYDGPRPKFFK